MRAVRWLEERFATPSAIYGLILYAALIAAISEEASEGDHGPQQSSLEVLLLSLVSLAIFYLAHVFAETLAGHGQHGFRTALRRGTQHSNGMLYSAIAPTLVLLVFAIADWPADDAADLSLLIATIVLGLLGALAFARRGLRWWWCLLGALGTALLGGIVMLLNYLVH